jgi:hypothetical protein
MSCGWLGPLCRTHHRENHRCGNEDSWWQNAGLDPLTAARMIWLETHPLPTEGTPADNKIAAAFQLAAVAPEVTRSRRG